MSGSRRLLLLLSVAMVVDTAAYSAITPLLPHLVERYELSKAAAGVLTAAYAFGTLALSVPAASLVARIGPRPVMLAALTVLGLASLAFGLAGSPALLIGARLVQGIGACTLWAAGLAWTVAATSPARRAQALGAVVGAAIAGSIGGPVLGALGDAVGTGAVYAVFVAFPAVLIVLVARETGPRPDPSPALGALRIALGSGRMRLGLWLMTLPSLAFGAIYLLVPLRLDALGAGSAVIGAVFLAAAACESTMSPIVGRIADRRGAEWPARVGLAGAGALLVALALPLGAVLVAAVVLALAAVLGMLWAPAMTILSQESDARGIDPAFGFGLANLGWGGGTAIGGAGGGALAAAVGDPAPLLVLAVAAGVTSLALTRLVAAYRSAAGQAIR